MTLSPSHLGHWIGGHWHTANAENAIPLFDAVSGKVVAYAGAADYEMADAYQFAREVGYVALRCITFHERGRMLKQLALYLLSRKEEFYQISFATGATRVDAWIDIEGGIGNLFVDQNIPSLQRKNFTRCRIWNSIQNLAHMQQTLSLLNNKDINHPMPMVMGFL